MTKAEQTKQFIIEQSAPIFNTKGIAATAMSDIMEATKLAKGSLYVHFENKEELASAVVDYNLHLLKKRVLSAMEKQTTAKDKLFTYLEIMQDPLNPPVYGGCPMINFGMEADDTNPSVKETVAEAIDSAITMLTQVINTGISNKEFNPGWNAAGFAVALFTMTEGAIFVSRVSGNSSRMRTVVQSLKKEIETQML